MILYKTIVGFAAGVALVLKLSKDEEVRSEGFALTLA